MTLPAGQYLDDLWFPVQEDQQQSVLGGAVPDQEFTQAVRASFQNLSATVEQLLNVLQMLLSITFITIFTQ